MARVERRLAAIVSVDVAGYSQLLGRDEAGTLARFHAHRVELIDPAVADHGGRIVKAMGDGLLLEFASVVAAVQCAQVVQLGMREREAAADPDVAMRVRIGIYLGDVIVEDGDVFGEGVGIATRLQEIAEPGGLAISGNAHDHLDEAAAGAFADAGEIALKNIRRPIRTWRWRGGAPAAVRGPAPQARPSVAVLPFDNLTRDPDQDYFAEGIAEDIVTELSRLPPPAPLSSPSVPAPRWPT